jgi:MFS family permease
MVRKRDVPPRQTFRAFANRQYVRLWLSNFLSYTARWMQMILLPWLILELTDSPWLVALVGFFSSIPMLVLGLPGGVLADEMNRKRLLFVTQAANVVASLLLTVLLAAEAVQVWHAYVVTLINGACWALSMPARRAMVFDLLGASGVTNAVALDMVGMNGSRMLGPALGGALITLVGVTGGCIVISLFYAIGLVLLGSLHVHQMHRPTSSRRQIGRNLLEGFRYVREHQTILATIYITVVMNMLLFPYMPMVAVMARDVLHVDPLLMGALQAAEGLGALAGAIGIAATVTIHHHGRIFWGGSLLALGALLLFSLSRWYVLSFPALLCLGFGTAGFGTMQTAIVMLVAKEDLRGRALGVISLAIGAGPLGSLLIGAVADAVSPVFALRMSALLGIIAMACIALVFPTIIDRTQTPVPAGQRE